MDGSFTGISVRIALYLIITVILIEDIMDILITYFFKKWLS